MWLQLSFLDALPAVWAGTCASLLLIQPRLGFVVYDGGDSGRGQLKTRTSKPAGSDIAGTYTGMSHINRHKS